jgi:catechol 2,3-dioxygenase-like lactoylglutathione lyase family enzyme
MLIDWELAGNERRFEIRVPDVQQATSFYRVGLGARELFRQATSTGEALRVGFAVGKVEFTVASESQGELERPQLGRLAAELGSDFLAVVLYVEDPELATRRALEAGSRPGSTLELPDVRIVVDPFGGHWAFVKRKAVPRHR